MKKTIAIVLSLVLCLGLLAGCGSSKNAEEKVITTSSDNVGYKVIGQIFETYIIVQKGNEMLLIDQHAAHERILFERFLSRSTSTPPAIQQLLIPEQLELDKKTLAFFTRQRI